MEQDSPSDKFPDVCLAVLNWNGRKHLEKLIPSLLESVSNYPGRGRVLILENPSPSNDLPWMREKFPVVDIIESPENDYMFSYNWLLPLLKEPVVVLLNNDLIVMPNFLEPLVRPFEDPSVFAVGAKSLDWDGRTVTSAAYRLGVHHGWHYFDGFESQKPVYTLFAVGGFMAVNRLKFLQLKGFDRLFHPAYGEDADLCFRAWLRGWTSIYQPESNVRHREGASWDDPEDSRRHYLMIRAQFLFNARNFGGIVERLKRTLYLKVLCLQKMGEGGGAWKRGLAEARSRWQEKSREISNGKVHPAGMEKIFRKIGTPWVNCPE